MIRKLNFLSADRMKKPSSQPAISADADYLAPHLSADQKGILYGLPDESSGNQDKRLFHSFLLLIPDRVEKPANCWRLPTKPDYGITGEECERHPRQS